VEREGEGVERKEEGDREGVEEGDGNYVWRGGERGTGRGVEGGSRQGGGVPCSSLNICPTRLDFYTNACAAWAMWSPEGLE
jgi:hypothetical protein